MTPLEAFVRQLEKDSIAWEDKAHGAANSLRLAAITIKEMAMVLKPFADMHRETHVVNDVAYERGVGHSKTIITSQDFKNAWDTIYQ